MKPKVLHQEAMSYSNEAKREFSLGNYQKAHELYKKSAEIENSVADFFMNREDLEPTRSIIIRSAAFLNIKAGDIEKAKEYIFWGLLNLSDENIKKQLNDALEVVVSYGALAPEEVSKQYSHLTVLRQNSINYIIEPAKLTHGHSIGLDMIRSFADDYTKSIKAYTLSKIKDIIEVTEENINKVRKEINEIINPLIVNAGYSSLRFGLANDFIRRGHEESEIIKLKENVIEDYHNEILINPLNENDIKEIKEKYTDDEIDSIFKPLIKMRSVNSNYNIGFYEKNSFRVTKPSKIGSKQKSKLISLPLLSKEDIGVLENKIIHKREQGAGKLKTTTIHSEILKEYKSEFEMNMLEPKNLKPIILNYGIVIEREFNAEIGFTLRYLDLDVEFSAIDSTEAFYGFTHNLIEKIKEIINNRDRPENKEHFLIVKDLISNIDSIE
ncbi:hypothetical protein [Elizabethkingia ursingii]|uniref:hypothetical protein n=1 Tax=Elizabethkingia ursingii TaxID=1756150 RepID=UPI0020134C36|nr:hypothetical protein [Elizabethkingia ursingii]MCL1671689.1 hypothetical protein [Elizabethkingia ursingii]